MGEEALAAIHRLLKMAGFHLPTTGRFCPPADTGGTDSFTPPVNIQPTPHTSDDGLYDDSAFVGGLGLGAGKPGPGVVSMTAGAKLARTRAPVGADRGRGCADSDCRPRSSMPRDIHNPRGQTDRHIGGIEPVWDHPRMPDPPHPCWIGGGGLSLANSREISA